VRAAVPLSAAGADASTQRSLSESGASMSRARPDACGPACLGQCRRPHADSFDEHARELENCIEHLHATAGLWEGPMGWGGARSRGRGSARA
jgi:hypothetical protein